MASSSAPARKTEGSGRGWANYRQSAPLKPIAGHVQPFLVARKLDPGLARFFDFVKDAGK